MGCYQSNSNKKQEIANKKLTKIIKELKKEWSKSLKNKTDINKYGFLSSIQKKLALSNISYKKEIRKESEQDSEDLVESLFKTFTNIKNLSSFVNWATNDEDSSYKLAYSLENMLKNENIRKKLIELCEIIIVSKIMKEHTLKGIIELFYKFKKENGKDLEVSNFLELVSVILQRFFDRFGLTISQFSEAYKEINRLSADFLKNMSIILSGPNENKELLKGLSSDLKIIICVTIICLGSSVIKKFSKNFNDLLKAHEQLQVSMNGEGVRRS